jgi:hypothetical protein
MFRNFNVENFTNLPLSNLRRCRRESNHSSFYRELFFNHFVKKEIGWSKVVTPLTATMNFINAYHSNISFEFTNVLNKETFWGYEQHFYHFLLNLFNNSLLGSITLLHIYRFSRYKYRHLFQLINDKRY